MSKKPAKVQFNGGEISPWLEGRIDFTKYDKSAKLCRNFIPVVEGSLKRRGGTLFVAKTSEEDSLMFEIIAEPIDAKILINGVEKSKIYVSRGDVVKYEVSLDGYVSCVNEVTVFDDTSLVVKLVSKSEMCKLSIVTEPSDAIVKIEGYERNTYSASKNSEVLYMVYKDGYETITGKIILDEDKSLNISLEKIDNTNVLYGSWGDPTAFISCTVVGRDDKHLKCFMLRFSNGYLPILFDANLDAPDENYVIDESLFINNIRDGYNALYWKNGDYHLGNIERIADGIAYYDLDGKLVAGFDYLTCKVVGWPIDDENRYASEYSSYDGIVNNGVFQIYRFGKLVWELKGRYDE